MIVGDALRLAAARLLRAGVESPRIAAEWSLAARLGIGRLELPLRYREALTFPCAQAWEADLERLAAGEPIQYVMGSAVFFGREFRVDSRALIPRPETEELACRVLACDELWARPKPGVCDVGTGSGCLAITLALERPGAVLLGSDLSGAALALASENARHLGAESRVRWICADLLDGVEDASLDAVVSNPPYIESGALAMLDRQVRDFEPGMALDGGPDGLRVIRRLIPQAFRTLLPGGRLWLEIGETQAGAVSALAQSAGFRDIAVAKDIAGRDRILSARIAG